MKMSVRTSPEKMLNLPAVTELCTEYLAAPPQQVIDLLPSVAARREARWDPVLDISDREISLSTRMILDSQFLPTWYGWTLALFATAFGSRSRAPSEMGGNFGPAVMYLRRRPVVSLADATSYLRRTQDIDGDLPSLFSFSGGYTVPGIFVVHHLLEPHLNGHLRGLAAKLHKRELL